MRTGSYGNGALLELVGEVMALLDLAQFRAGLLDALTQAVPSEWASFNELAGDEVVAGDVQPPFDDATWRKWLELGHENPLYRAYLDSGDGRAYRFSDVVTRREFEATRLFREFYAPLRINHQIAFTLPAAPGRVVAVALSRAAPDYSVDERDFLNRARPYLVQAYRNAIDYSERDPGLVQRLEPALRGAGLAPRQAQAVRLVALGKSNRDVAATLELSERTVQKHLEQGFRKLGVSSRSAAAARAWDLARNPG